MLGAAYIDRRHAGKQLGSVLRHQLSEQEDIVVFGLVRGGLPVAEPVADALSAPCDAFVSRKIGAPLQPEFGIGAIAEGGSPIINEYAAHAVGASPAQLQAIIARESRELQRRIEVYRGGRDHLPVAGKTVVVVDDGLATGVTARAALQALRTKGPKRVVLAVPVGSASTVAELTAEHVADEVVCLSQPKHFRAVGQWYEDFNQTTDDEVVAILRRFENRNAAARRATVAHGLSEATAPGPTTAAAAAAAAATTTKGVEGPAAMAPAGSEQAAAGEAAQQHKQAAFKINPPVGIEGGPDEHQPGLEAAAAAPAPTTPSKAAAAAAAPRTTMIPTVDEEVIITDASSPGVKVHGTLNAPEGAKGLVIFAHGSGSSRHSPRNRQVASTLNEAGFATLLFDLLTEQEASNRANVFNILLLASRLQLAAEWMEVTGKLPVQLPLGFFGASTGGGAALWAAAYLDKRVSAVVVRGGRPDLAAEKLPVVVAPTLLLVGGEDTRVLELNRAALQLLGAAGGSELVVVPGAGHLFEGRGQLETVAELAAGWFAAHMVQEVG